VIKGFKTKSEFSRNVFTLMTGTVIAQAIPVIISPILTRIYTPEDFGVFALFTAIVGFISIFASFGYDQAILIPKYDKYAINIFALGFILISVTVLMVFILITLFKFNILNLLRTPVLGQWLFFIPGTVFFIGLFNLLTNYNNRTKHYRDIAKATVIKSLVLSVIQVSMGVLKSGLGGLILSQAIAQIFANVKMSKNIFKEKELMSGVSKIRILAVAKKYKNFPKYYMPHALISTISSSLPVYIFTPYFGSSAVGYYSLSIMVMLSPMMIIATSTAKVFNQRILELHNSEEETYTFALSIVKSLVKIIFIPFFLFVFFAPQIFGLIFGEDWVEAGVYTQILSIYIFLNVIVSVIAYISSFKNLQKKAFRVALFHFLLLTGTFYLMANTASVLVALGAMSIINSLVLIYNFLWMINSLKMKNEK
jgi:O-antigen/teichoic acid export membrane protein